MARDGTGGDAAEDSMRKAVIFDVDGTLIDSVDFHAFAWHEALKEFGHDVSFEKARSQIGKGGDQLLPVFLSEKAISEQGADIEMWRGKRFSSTYLPWCDLSRRFQSCSIDYVRRAFWLRSHRPRNPKSLIDIWTSHR
jgi:hypothetical protein